MDGQLDLLAPLGPHPWGHGAEAVGVHGVECGHREPKGGGFRYRPAPLPPRGLPRPEILVVCLACALRRCPVCSQAGRNVCLDD